MILLPEITSFDLYSILRFHALCAFVSISIGLSFERHQQTGHFPSKSDLGALSSTTLESHMRSARSAHLHIPLEQRQNTLLLRKFQSGCAILKSLRISYAKRKQGSANDHFTGRTKHTAFQQIRIGCAILKSLRISYTQSRQWTSSDHVTLLKTDHFSSKLDLGALSSNVLESHGLRHLLITLTPNQNMLFIREIASGRAIFNTLRIS